MMPKWHHFADVFVRVHVLVLVVLDFSFPFGLDLKCIFTPKFTSEERMHERVS